MAEIEMELTPEGEQWASYVQRIAELEAERDKLKETIVWIWDHSNDPAVVERAREALN